MSWTEQEDEQQAPKKQVDNETLSTQPQDSQTISSKDNNSQDSKILQLLEKTLNENIVEKRRARRWKIFFRLLTFSIIACLGVFWFTQQSLDVMSVDQNEVALMPMRGTIGANAEIDSTEYVSLIDEAYRNPNLEALVIQLNSPGGSPVHSGLIYDAIKDKQVLYPSIPVIVVVEDMAASGGYYIAAAADEIYANKASLVGSIGVISSGFDATGLMDKIGVERRTFTAGRNKAFLDPFSPMTEEARGKWQAVLNETHQQFIDAVMEGRGNRLKINDDVFSGLVFTGAKAEKIGLIDGLSSINDILNNRFANANVVVYQPYQESWRELAKELGVEIATKVFTDLKLN
ncbi:signal peptide peptidase SppA [Marinomonas sp.]